MAGVEGIFRDISERKAGEAKIHKYLGQMEFLSQKVLDFIDLPTDADIYRKIGRDMVSLVPEAMIVVNSYDPLTGSLTIQSVSGEEKRALCARYLGREPEGLIIPVDAANLNSLRTSRIYRAPGTLFEMVSGTLSREICEQLSQALDLGDVYAVGFVRSGKAFGNAVMFLHQDACISDISLVEMYARQASIALQKSHAEHALRQSEELFMNVAELSPFPVCIVDTDGRYRYVNTGFTRLFGYTPDDFTTWSEWLRLVFPDPAYRKDVAHLWKEDLPDPESGKRPERTFKTRCRDGSEKEILFRSVHLRDGKLCIIFEDITERKQAERVGTPCFHCRIDR